MWWPSLLSVTNLISTLFGVHARVAFVYMCWARSLCPLQRFPRVPCALLLLWVDSVIVVLTLGNVQHVLSCLYR